MFLIDESLKISYDSLISDLNHGVNPHLLCSFTRDIVNGKEINLASYRGDSKLIGSTISSKEELLKRISESESTIFLQTSGTTGERKTVKHKISDLLADTKKATKDNTWLYTYNPFHMGGIQVLLQALINGDTIIYAYKGNREYILNAIKKFEVTHISSTPTFYKLLSPFEESYRSVVRATVGGERADSRTFRLVKQMFPNAKITNIYALTEAGSVLYSSSDVFTLSQKCKVVDDVLYVKDRSGEWCDTGDSVELVGESNFRFVGRRKNIINIAGNDVNPTEIENLLKGSERIRDAIVYEKTSSLLGNVLVCDIIKEDLSITEKEVKQHFKNEKLESYQTPRIINFIEKLKISDNLKTIV